MANYIIHFEDGSDAYLSHHGKIGMHWGEWNDETRKRYMEHPDLIGDYAKALNTHAYNQSFQDSKKLNPVEAGVKNIGAAASKILTDATTTLSSIRQKALTKGAMLVADALFEGYTQTRYLTEGFRPVVRDDSTSGRVDKWHKHGYKPIIINTDESLTKPRSRARATQHVSQHTWDVVNSRELSKYNKSIPKKLRNIVGLK